MPRPYKICFLGYMKLGDMARQVIAKLQYEDTVVIEKECSFDTLPQAVDQGLAEGCEVFIAGSANAAEFRNRSYDHLVEIRVDLADYLLSIHKAAEIGAERIAIAVYRYSPSPDAELLRRLSPCPVELIRYEDSAELYGLLRRSACDTVIGASFAYEAAESLGKKGVLIYESEYTINASIEQARRLAAELRAAAREREITNAIIRNSPAGIIVTDEQGRILVFSAAARRLTAPREGGLRGRLLERVIPELPAAFQRERDQQERRLLIDGAMIRCVRTELRRGDEPIGTLYTLLADNARRRKEPAEESVLPQPTGSLADMIASSKAMEDFLGELRPLAALEHPLMIRSEAGTGKRFVAQCVHNASPRAGQPYLPLNAAAIAPQDAARVLFGTEDAAGARPGLLEQAGGGTLVLTDLARSPDPVKACLLQALTERSFFRVGGLRPVPFRARCLTLAEEGEREGLPEALWQRLSVFTLTIPPLRERREDVLPLFRRFLLQESGLRLRGGELAELLESYSWPGNLTALAAVSKRYALFLSQAVRPAANARRLLLIRAIGEEELLRDLCEQYPALRHASDSPPEEVLEGLAAVKRLLNYNNSMIAEKFGLSRTTLWRMRRQLEERSGGGGQ